MIGGLDDDSAFHPYYPDPTKTVKDGPHAYRKMANGFLFYFEATENLGPDIDDMTRRVVPKGSGS